MAEAKHRTVRKVLAVFGAGACALGLGLALSGNANASTESGHIYSSNGEAGYYTWSSSPFNENYAFVTPTTVAEQMNENGGVGLQLGALSSQNVYKQSVGQKCYVAQIGLVWNTTTKAFDVVAGEGYITYTGVGDNGSTNPDACTTGGALSSAAAIASPNTVQTGGSSGDGYTTTTTWSEDFLQGIPAGDQVYLNELRIGSGDIKFTAFDNDATFISGSINSTVPVFSLAQAGNPHFAGAGTVFDLTNRTSAVQASANQEASFYLLRAGQWDSNHGHFSTQVNVYNAWLAQQVQSSPNGQSSDPAAVTPFNTLNNPYGGIFNLYVGAPVGP